MKWGTYQSRQRKLRPPKMLAFSGGWGKRFGNAGVVNITNIFPCMHLNYQGTTVMLM